MIADWNYKALLVEILEGMSGLDMANGLHALQAKLFPLTLVVSGAGTGLKTSVVNLQTQEGGLLFHNTHLLSLDTDSQQKYLAECYMQVLKKLIRTGLHSKIDHRIPCLTIS